MRKSIIVTACLVLLMIFTKCADNESEISSLKYGTSFGMCVGYCKHDMTLESGFVTYTRSGWQDTVKTQSCHDMLDQDTWRYFSSGINIDSFLNLPHTIGCPDCADGGAEWIEAELANGEVHRVTFEYGNPPVTIKAYVDSLRVQMSLSSQCGD